MWFGLVEMKCNNLEWCVSGEDPRPERRETARQESDGAIECEYTFNILRENILRLVWFKEHLKTDGSKGFTLLKTRKTTFSIGSSSSFEYDKVVEISLMTLLTLLRIF